MSFIAALLYTQLFFVCSNEINSYEVMLFGAPSDETICMCLKRQHMFFWGREKRREETRRDPVCCARASYETKKKKTTTMRWTKRRRAATETRGMLTPSLVRFIVGFEVFECAGQKKDGKDAA